MALTAAELNAVWSVDEGPLNRSIDQSESRFAGLGRKAALAMAAVGAAVGGVAVKGIADFAGFQSGMNEVFTLLPGISGQAMDDMSGQVKDFAKDFGVLPDDVVPALYQSLSAGVPSGNVFEFLETAQKAAKGGVTDLTTAVDGISSVVNAYGDDVISAKNASDLMFTAVRLGKTDFSQLSGSLYNVIPTASALGVQFGDVTAAMAAMTSQGTPTSVATTQMRQLLVELSKDGGTTSDTFKELAGKSFKDFVASGGDVQQALQLMEGHAKDTGVGVNDLFGSVEAGNAALALTGKGTESFTDALAGMQDSAGATEGAYQQMDQGLSASWDRIKAAGSVALLDLGDNLAPLVQKVSDFAVDAIPKAQAALESAGAFITDTVVPALQSMKQWVEENETPIKIVAGVIMALFIPHLIALAAQSMITAVTTVASWVMTQAAAIGAAIVHSGQVIGMVAKWAFLGAQSLLHAAKVAAAWVIAMGPVGWVIAAVVGLVALIIANWDKVKRFTGAAWDWVSSKVSGAARWAKDAAVSTFTGLVSWVSGLPGRIIGALGNLGSLLLGAGKDLIRGFINGIKNMAGAVAGAAMDVAKGAVNGIKNFLGISSPSKVFAGLGENVGEGFVQGIAGMRPAVAAEMARLADTQALGALTVRPPAGARIAGASTGVGQDPAAAAGGDRGRGSLFHADSVTVIEGTPDDVARQLELGARTRGHW
jgi:TP901 family phage tail tape measure protein